MGSVSPEGGSGIAPPQLPWPPAFHWRRDAFGRPLVHIADVTRRPLVIRDREIRQNLRYVFSVHGNPVMLDSAEDATTGRCADCLAWLAKQAKR